MVHTATGDIGSSFQTWTRGWPRSGAGDRIGGHMSVRAGIVVTGTEVLTGRVADLNGPWVADRLLELGVELAHITICGDRAADIEAQLRFLAAEGVDLIVTTGDWGRPPTT